MDYSIKRLREVLGLKTGVGITGITQMLIARQMQCCEA
jgi:hypothetical protein